MCGFPPEYCQNANKDFSECKNWVKTAHPELYNQIYGIEEEKKLQEGAAKKEGEEEKKDTQP